jgi:hypothetical protein
MWPAKAPFRRAARWDGVAPIGRDLPLNAMLSPQEIREIVQYIEAQPGYTTPFEVVHSGILTGTDRGADRALVAEYEDAGVTWWAEKILPERWGSWAEWPLDAMRAHIRQGPPRQ